MHPNPRAWQPPLQTSAGSLRASEPSRAHSTRATLGNPPPSTRPDKQPLRHPERPKPFSESGKAGMEALRGKRGSKVQKPLRKQGPRRQWGYRRKPSDNRPFPVSKSRAKWRPPRRSPASPPETELLPNSGRPPARVRFASARKARPPEPAARATPSPGTAHAPLALFSVGPKPRPFCVLRGGLGAESSRDHSSLSLLQHLVANGAGKRGGAGAGAESGGGGGGGRWPV